MVTNSGLNKVPNRENKWYSSMYNPLTTLLEAVASIIRVFHGLD